MREARVKQGESIFEDGTRVIFESLDEIEINENPSEVSVHEAWHVLAALLVGLDVKSVTVIPEGDALGATHTNGYNAIAFAAAHAKGCRGTSHDLHVIKLMDGETSSAVSAAQALLSGPKRHRQMLAIATMLDKRKTMGGSESWAILADVTKEQEEGKLHLIRIIAPNGREVTEEKRAKTGEIVSVKEPLTLIRLVDREKEKTQAKERADILVHKDLVRPANDN